ncbi:nucleoside hydrolase, partial [Candidatus Poribacteria bacterium]|nr:nucleoside hydrolase [Candidatus Poribacteria bacterium]
MKYVILDMDPGVDDALAIILAMLSPELEVKAITTVSGNVNVDLCTRNVRVILEILGINPPPIIAKGESKPLAENESIVDAAEVHGRDGLGNLGSFFMEDGTTRRYEEPSICPVSEEHAVDVILSLLSSNPYEITLIPTGPLTNIARTFMKDPEITSLVKEIIIMGGAFRVPGNITPVAEFNIYSDPHAAELLVKSNLPITFIGLDVTHQVWLKKNQLLDKIVPMNNRLSRFIRDVTSVYMGFHEYYELPGIYIHDALAVAAAIEPKLVETEEIYLQIESHGKITKGMTVG